MNSKKKGWRVENKAVKVLEAAGYHVTRAAGSFGVFDLIAINAQGLRLIQVKSNRNASPVEREQIELFNGLPPNTTKEIWIFRDYARQPVINLIATRE